MRIKFLISLALTLSFSWTCFAQEKAWSVFPGTSGLPGSGKSVVLVAGDDEYRSEQMLHQLGKILAKHHGFDCTVLYCINPENGEIDPVVLNNIPGLELLEQADIAVFFLRFRNLPDEQMKFIDSYLRAGKPILGIRTSTHAFSIPPGQTYSRYSFNYDDNGGPWQQGFGRLVLGETWINHHGHHGVEATRGVIAPGQEASPIVKGCDDLFGPSDVYTVRLPLPGDCQPLVLGTVLVGMNATDPPLPGPKNEVKMPIAWTKTYQLPDGKKGNAFTSTMGCAKDFQSEGYRRLLVNAVYWLAGLEAEIPDRSQVEIVGTYEPLDMGSAKYQKGVKPNEK
ncbi:MAG: ThuA domain-containing protein [Planctomycetaceae bacterium]|nr:ThuA domain-containing protein [Planctomycetaceae bacterium]